MQMFKSKYTQELYYFFDSEWYTSKKQQQSKVTFMFNMNKAVSSGSRQSRFCEIFAFLHFQITHYMIEAADVSHFRHRGWGGGVFWGGGGIKKQIKKDLTCCSTYRAQVA